jgi:hypothetical protein
LYSWFKVSEARLTAIILIIINILGLLFISPSGTPTEQRFMATLKRLPSRQWRNDNGSREGTVRDFSCDAWRGKCLTGRGDNTRSCIYDLRPNSIDLRSLFLIHGNFTVKYRSNRAP